MAHGARSYQSPPGGVNWLTVNSAPWGSRTIAFFVHRSSEDRTIVAPSRSAVSTLASRSATVKQTCRGALARAVTARPRSRRRTRAAPRTDARGSRDRRGGEMVAVPRDLDHRPRSLLHVDRPPAEHRRVEAHRCPAVRRVQVAKFQAPGVLAACGRASCPPATGGTPPRVPDRWRCDRPGRRPPGRRPRAARLGDGAAVASASSTATYVFHLAVPSAAGPIAPTSAVERRDQVRRGRAGRVARSASSRTARRRTGPPRPGRAARCRSSWSRRAGMSWAAPSRLRSSVSTSHV